MRIALYQPDIPQNTGNILRMAACFGVPVDVIGPCGFLFSTKLLRRSGMDYLDHVDVTRHEHWPAFRAEKKTQTPLPRLILLTTKSRERFTDFSFAPNDILLFGSESAGVPDLVHRAADHRLTIPMCAGRRSLNLSSACAMVVCETLRQLALFPPLCDSETP